MVKSMFAAVAGLRTHQQKMDVIGNNIANVNTYGFKKARVTFKDQFYTTLNAASEPQGTSGGGNPSQIGYGSSVGSIDINFSTGGSSPTDNPTDAMISGNGFFLVGPKHEKGYAPTSNAADLTNVDPLQGSTDSPEGLYMTRVGNFTFGSDGYLTDSAGNVVYGYINYEYRDPSKTPNYTVMAHDGETLENGKVEGSTLVEAVRLPLVLMKADGTPFTNDANEFTIIFNNPTNAAAVPPEDGCYYAPMKTSSVSMGTDGTITAKFNNQPIVIGKLGIADVPNPNALMASGGTYYEARGNTGVITVATAGSGGTGKIESSRLEMANVDLSQEMSDMILTQRGFQANTRIITVTDEMLQELINMKR